MQEASFNLYVPYKGEQREFQAKLIVYGYAHKFHVDVDGVGILFEPDEERQYRAVLDNEAIEKNLNPNEELTMLIRSRIAELF